LIAKRLNPEVKPSAEQLTEVQRMVRRLHGPLMDILQALNIMVAEEPVAAVTQTAAAVTQADSQPASAAVTQVAAAVSSATIAGVQPTPEPVGEQEMPVPTRPPIEAVAPEAATAEPVADLTIKTIKWTVKPGEVFCEQVQVEGGEGPYSVEILPPVPDDWSVEGVHILGTASGPMIIIIKVTDTKNRTVQGVISIEAARPAVTIDENEGMGGQTTPVLLAPPTEPSQPPPVDGTVNPAGDSDKMGYQPGTEPADLSKPGGQPVDDTAIPRPAPDGVATGE
jgi:hypothetical protein